MKIDDIFTTKGMDSTIKGSREDIIKRYQDIIKRWKADGELIELFPDKYREICVKLKALQDGVEYTVRDVARECIMDMGAKIRDIQQMYNSSGGVLADHSKQKYEYETDITQFVDRVINNKIHMNKGE